jgi:hypothetical protein
MRASDGRWDTPLGSFARTYGVRDLATSLGVHPQAVMHWVAGRHVPRPELALELVELAREMGDTLTMSEVYGKVVPRGSMK